MTQTLEHSPGRYFIALVIEGDPGAYITALKEEMALKFKSSKALNSPPHITLIPPFFMTDQRLHSDLVQDLNEFAGKYNMVELHMSEFGSFAPRVIYVKPSPSPYLEEQQKQLENLLVEKYTEIQPSKRSFHPHVTIGFRDLAKDTFHEAWEYFSKKSIQTSCVIEKITVLKHNGERWLPYVECTYGIAPQ